MSNQQFKAITTGLGVGMLAATLSAAAHADQSFGSSMIFYKQSPTATYLVTVPNGNRGTDSFVLVELALVDATKNTWNLGASVGNISATGGAVAGITLPTSDPAHGTIQTVDAYGASLTIDLTSTDSAGSAHGQPALVGLWGAVNRTWLVPGSNSYSNTVGGVLAMGSGTGAAQCYYTMNITVDTDGNFKVNTGTANMSVTISDGTGFSSLSNGANSFYFLNAATNTTYAASQWTSFGSAALGNWDAQRSGSINFPSSIFKVAYSATSSAVSSTNTGAVDTAIGSSVANFVNKINSCVAVYNNRTALNNSGLIIGGNNGLARIW